MVFIEEHILNSLKHENIIGFKELIEKPNSYNFIIEYCKHGTLSEYLNHKSISEKQIKKIVIQILQGLSYIHSSGFIHRDIKPENILIKSKKKLKIKIIDFGLCLFDNKPIVNTSQCGSIFFISPEMLFELIKRIHWNCDKDY